MPRLPPAVGDAVLAVRTFLRRRGADIAIALTVVYFGYHLVHGQRGLLAWIDRAREVEITRHELGQIEADRAALQDRVQQLRPGTATRDAIEEELRRLGYVAPDELIVLPTPPTRK